MGSPNILLIDDNPLRTQQVETVLKFLEYDLTCVTTTECADILRDRADFDLVWVGDAAEKQASLLRIITEKTADLPVFLLVDKDAQTLSSSIEHMVTRVLEWPTVHSVLTEELQAF